MMNFEENKDIFAAAKQKAKSVRKLYEIMEKRINGQVWTNEELMLGLMNDTGLVSRLLLAKSGTWDMEDNVDYQLEYKLSEIIWWVLVIADRYDIDMSSAFTKTMDTIEQNLKNAVEHN